MERILDENEKIRRAEEIYYRRNNINAPLINKKESSTKGIIKTKLLFNLLILFNISVIVFAIQNKDFIFTKEFLGVLANYNNEISLKITDYIKGIWKTNDEEENQNALENVQNTEIQEESGQENPTLEEKTEISESSSINEMELDIQNLNAAYSFIKPIDGIVSSGFGARESAYQNVTGYHTGVDIAQDKGTVIKASMGGIVDLVSKVGDYGKHIKIRCNNVTTLYAHCSKIYVKEGQIVAAGDPIAEVGSTGNSTGNHLHFEIRVNDRFVDPSRIISF